ncbi:hypothetical protein B0J11DRAFT_577585 [Dendryphion nanum]|uniref:Uncharacterized protein n=1 Tax=Dendryphion nanum TaxID=256645 RepID=A0A9P9E4W9_9PLEO|nr:hypothetical protein B0J11DRAFT_577585 [Dendryphion nanum]
MSRFCRKGVVEPAKDDAKIWFFHAPGNPFLADQTNNDTQNNSMEDFTWRPGRPGELPLDVNNPRVMATQEEKTRTFHPKPDGFEAEKDAILSKMIRLQWQEELADRTFQIIVVGDITAIGDHCGFNGEIRYGLIPYLDKILGHAGNFKGKDMLYGFNGRNSCGYSGDRNHEIWPELKTIDEIAGWVLLSPYLRLDRYRMGTVLPIMVGSKDIMNGRSLDDMKVDMHAFLQNLWMANPKIVVLLGTIPMHGDPEDKDTNFGQSRNRSSSGTLILPELRTTMQLSTNGRL